MPITTKVVSSNSVQHYMIKVCQWLVTGGWFSLVSSTNKTDHHDIKVESDIKHHNQPNQYFFWREVMMVYTLKLINLLFFYKTLVISVQHQEVHIFQFMFNQYAVRTIVKTTLVTDNINCVPSFVLHTQYSL